MGIKKQGVSYAEAVEEAICYGWIDGIVKGIDGEKYAQRFTPRKERSNWTSTNVKVAERMIRKGKMTPAGLEKYQLSRREAVPLKARSLTVRKSL